MLAFSDIWQSLRVHHIDLRQIWIGFIFIRLRALSGPSACPQLLNCNARNCRHGSRRDIGRWGSRYYRFRSCYSSEAFRWLFIGTM